MVPLRLEQTTGTAVKTVQQLLYSKMVVVQHFLLGQDILALSVTTQQTHTCSSCTQRQRLHVIQESREPHSQILPLTLHSTTLAIYQRDSFTTMQTRSTSHLIKVLD